MAAADLSRETLVNSASNSESGAQLRRHLDGLAKRHNAQMLWHEIARALCWGCGIAVLCVLAYKLYLIDGLWWQPALIVLFSALIGWRNGTLRRAGAFDAALDADNTLELKDRLASALAFTYPEEVRRRQHSADDKKVWARLRHFFVARPVYANAVPTAQTSLVPALIHDATTRAGELNPKTVYPFKFGKTQKVLTAMGLFFVGSFFVPNMTFLLPKEDQLDAKKTLPETGKKLQAIAKEVKENKDIKETDEAKKLAKKLEALGQRIERARMGKKEAMVEMAQLREKIAQAANKPQAPFKSPTEPDAKLGQEQMQTDEGKKMQEQLKKGDMEKAAKELEKLAAKIEKNEMSKEEREKAANDLQKAADAMRRQGGQQNQEMAQKLEDAAKALKQQNQQEKDKQNGQQEQKQGQQDGQKQGQQGQNGQQEQKQGQKQGQQGQQGQNGQKQGQKQGQQQNGQSGSQQGNKQGQQPGQQSLSKGADALRKMAQGMQSGQGGQGQGQGNANSDSLQKMLDQIQEAERGAGNNGQGNNPGQNPFSGKGDGDGDGDGKGSPNGELKPSDPTFGSWRRRRSWAAQ